MNPSPEPTKDAPKSASEMILEILRATPMRWIGNRRNPNKTRRPKKADAKKKARRKLAAQSRRKNRGRK